MTSTTRYPQELRVRAVRLVLEHGGEYPSERAAIESISAKLGMTKETLRRWVRRAQVDGGLRSGVTTLERERIRELERENRELRRANEILRAASLFLPGSSTRDCPTREVHCREPGALGS
jgi:transposase